MAVKELQTRIALKYDSYDNWIIPKTVDDYEAKRAAALAAGTGPYLKLLPGEIGICEIPNTNGDSNVAPTVLFKVGGARYPEGHDKAGELIVFKDLPWASAKAADVYNWAKSEKVVLEGTTLKFKTGDTVNDYIELSKFALASDLATLSGDVAAIQASLGGSGDIGKAIDDVEARLDVIEGAGDGSISKAVAEAVNEVKAYADTAEADALSAAKSYTDAEVKKVADDLATSKNNIATNTSDIAENATAIANEKSARETAISNLDTAYKAADTEINNKIGTLPSDYTTLVAGIAAAKQAGTDAANAVSTLETSKVDKNAQDIATNAGEIAKNATAISNEVTRATGVEADFEERISAMETFWDTTEDKDGVVNKLKEIQDYIASDESGAATMAGNIQKNAQDITALQNIVKDGGTLEIRVDQAEADIGAVEGRAGVLEATVAGYDGTNTVKAAVEAVSVRAEKGITDAATADGKAVAAQGTADEVKAAVEHATTGLAATKKIADDAASDVASLKTRVGTAESTITTIQSLVTGANGNNTLRADITAIQNLVTDDAKGNEKLYTDLTALQGVVNHETTGLAATKVIADAAKELAETNAGAIADIQADYLKAADSYIFNCGTSSSVVHEAASN